MIIHYTLCATILEMLLTVPVTLRVTTCVLRLHAKHTTVGVTMTSIVVQNKSESRKKIKTYRQIPSLALVLGLFPFLGLFPLGLFPLLDLLLLDMLHVTMHNVHDPAVLCFLGFRGLTLLRLGGFR